jgi:hypothetical protein
MTDEDDFQRYLERYQAKVPTGIAGEREMRKRISVPFMDVTAEDVLRDELTLDEVNGWRSYMGWSLWDVIAQRSTEGESGLIPRQEYETISFLQMWSLYPQMMREMTDAVGVDGVIELGAAKRHQVGTKNNITRNWSPQNCCHLGRAIALELGLESPSEREGQLEGVIQFSRRLMYGTWGEGPGFACGREYKVRLLDQELIDRFLADEERLDDPDHRRIFRRFNATTELLGFIVHYDCRFGLQDTGPYEVPGGGFLLVRDHWLHEPAYPWTGPTEGLPYCVIEAMVFRPDEPMDVKINDIGTTFTKPVDYLRHLSGVAVYAKDHEDTPMSELRRVGPAEMEEITKKSAAATGQLYQALADKDRDQKIRDGINVYATDHIRPIARAAGVWEQFKPRIDELQELALAGWPRLADGQAATVLAPLFVKGLAYQPLQEATPR